MPTEQTPHILAGRLRELCAKIREWKRTGVDAIPSERELRLIHRASLALESPAPDVLQRVREAAMLGLSWGAGQALREKEKALRDIYAMCDQSAPTPGESPLRAEAAPTPLDVAQYFERIWFHFYNPLDLAVKAKFMHEFPRGIDPVLEALRAESPRLPAAPAPWTRAELEAIANDPALLEIGRRAIEATLIEWRDSRLSEAFRNNGLVVRAKDGQASSVIRFGPEKALSIGLRAIAQTLPATVPAPAPAREQE